jgi:D-alanine-D-alanine ligase
MQAHNLAALLDRMRSQARLAVIHGGDPKDPDAVVYSTRNPRSTKRYVEVATDIADSLKRSGFQQVHLLSEDMNLPQRLRDLRIDMAWLNTGGTQGLSSTSHAPSLLELCGVPYVGHNPLNAALLDNKHMFKHVVASLGLPTAPYVTVNVDEVASDIRQRHDFTKRFSNYTGDFIVKPVSGRASLHVHCVKRGDLPDAVAAVFAATGNTVLIESYLPGAEYTAGVSGSVVSRQGELALRQGPFVFSMLERLFEPSERIFTSKDMRPIAMGRLRLLDSDSGPAAYSIELITAKLFTRLGLESTVRVDFRSDEKGRVHILEANPKPDLKRPQDDVVSLMAAGLPQQGMDYDDLILSLLADRIYSLLVRRPEYALALQRFMDAQPGCPS